VTPDKPVDPTKASTQSTNQSTDVDVAKPATVNATVNNDTVEYGGPKGLEPTRYGDWEKNGRCSDF